MAKIETNPKSSPPPRELAKLPRQEPNPPLDLTVRMVQARKTRRDGR